METINFQVVEICRLTDPLLQPWKELYEQSFPATDRIPTARVLSGISEIERCQEHENHFLAAVDESGRFLGLMWLKESLDLPVAFLWYFAVIPEMRGRGLGAEFYQWLLRRLRPGMKALIFDVEDPQVMPTAEMQAIARRRIAFYQRLGARLIGGIQYIVTIEPDMADVYGRLMAHPLVDTMSAREAITLARPTLGEWIKPFAEIGWE